MARLRGLGAMQICAPDREEFDLRNLTAIQELLATAQPHIVIHLAARAGGIGANRARPAEFFYDNLMMGVQLPHES